MTKSYWADPVDIQLVGQSRIRTITTSEFAFECLTTMWPDGSHGPSFYAAILACFDALDGMASDQRARDAFIKAATDAGIRAHQTQCNDNRLPDDFFKPADHVPNL